MSVYYNEFDKHAASWLRNLMAAGLIPQGDVDERSIKEVQSSDLAGYDQCHFFAGIGGWCEALRLAGWGDRPVWTGSCPCQPYSTAGKGEGDNDARNLWPDFFRLIRECKPDTVFGEQVEGAIRHGWLDGICRDLETEGYAVGHTVLGAHSVGAPHIRQRLYWVGHASGGRRIEDQAIPRQPTTSVSLPESPSHGRGVYSTPRPWGCGREQGRSEEPGRSGEVTCGVGLADTASVRCDGLPIIARGVSETEDEGRLLESQGSGDGIVGDTDNTRCKSETSGRVLQRELADAACVGKFWGDYQFVHCRDGKSRRIESGIQPLVDGVPFKLADGRTNEGVSRAKVLRGIGNAIVPQVAAEFIGAYVDFLDSQRKVS